MGLIAAGRQAGPHIKDNVTAPGSSKAPTLVGAHGLTDPATSSEPPPGRDKETDHMDHPEHHALDVEQGRPAEASTTGHNAAERAPADRAGKSSAAARRRAGNSSEARRSARWP